MKKFCITGLLLAVLISAHAQVTGTWNVYDLTIPPAINFIMNGNGEVIDVTGTNGFGLNAATFNIDSGGNFIAPGGDPAQIQPLDQEQDLVVVSNGPAFPIAFNSAGDVLSGDFSEPDYLHNVLLLKPPASFTAGQLAGNWQIVTWDTPAAIIPVWSDTHTLVDLLGSDYQSLGTNWPPMGGGTLAVDSSGNFTADVGGDTNTGSIVPGSDGQLTISVNATPAFEFGGCVNSNLDLIASSNPHTNELEYDLIIKTATNPPVADLVGVWHVNNIQIPSSLDTNTFTFDNDFKIESFTVVAGYDGTLIAKNSDGIQRLSWASSTNGVDINGTDGILHGFINVSKSAMIINEGYTLDVVVRSPAVTSGTRNMGLFVQNRVIYWAPASSSTVLQSATGPAGPWTNISVTAGHNSYAPPNGTMFYRIKG